MARDLAPRHKHCRALGEKICGNLKCPVLRRKYPPGVHGPLKLHPKFSNYALQLREKQKAKWIYGILERQFRVYFKRARIKTGDTGANLVRALELRLDNTVYRLGFASTRPQARQMVRHGFFDVNNKHVDIPSFELRPGDVVTLHTTKRDKKASQELRERLKRVKTPSWLLLKGSEIEGKVLALPEGEDLHDLVDPKLIVELYSR